MPINHHNQGEVMTARIEKTVFISYRRTNLPWALAIYQELTHKGYDVFFDYLSIPSGDFEKIIIENIKGRAHFIVILTPSALERCNEPGDWLRREIETAMDEKRNVIPLMLESFDFGSPLVKEALIGKLASLNKFNGLRVYSEYFFEAMDKLRERYLKIAVSDIALPTLNLEAKEITESQKTAAREAPLVGKEELTAQEWFERGYVFYEAENYDEAIRCYTESLCLESSDAIAYLHRGSAYGYKHEFDNAIADYNESIRIRTNYADAYVGRGIMQYAKQNFNHAIADFNKAISIKPDYADAFSSRAQTYSDKGDLGKAIADYTEAIRLKPDDAGYYSGRANVLSAKGDNTNALTDLQQARDLDPENGNIRASLVRVYKSLGYIDDAKEQERIAREFIQKANEYNQACFEAICGNKEEAIILLKTALEKDQFDKEWARKDADFESIRNDPRFKELVGD